MVETIIVVWNSPDEISRNADRMSAVERKLLGPIGCGFNRSTTR